MVRVCALVCLVACGDKLVVGERKVSARADGSVEAFDAEYGRVKRYRTFRLAPVLDDALPGWRDQALLFSARDGYAVTISAARVLEGDAHVAVDDVDVPGFEVVGPRKVNPGPFYLVWPRGGDLAVYPRPYQLARIEMAPDYPHTKPGDDAKDGHALFLERCIRCHAINREGGHVGPDLNVPQNVTEYWADAQIRAYIKNPATFRYGNMPSHLDLSEAQLDSLLVYLHSMRARKYDTP